MKIRPWLDEGFAEYLSWLCIGKRNPILHESWECIENLDEVDRFLNDLSCEKRGLAFYLKLPCSIPYWGVWNNQFFRVDGFESMAKLSEIENLPTSAFAASAKSSHHVYKTPWQGDPRVNIQNNKGKAKAYQVKQVLLAVEKLEAGHGTKK